MNGSFLEELGSIRDHVPIRHVGWTRRSLDDQVNGFVRICVPENRASKFPSRLGVFGEAVSVQRIRPKQIPSTCDKSYDFHSTRTCARSLKCKLCGVDTHERPYQKAPRCLNCRGPHASTEKSCPDRPRWSNGVFIRPTGLQLQNIRAAGGREYAKAQNTADEPNMNLTSTAIGKSTPLRIMEVNVGQSFLPHNIALALANENNIDILLLQEPWIVSDLSAQRSISHRTFQSFSPLTTWHSRPRVLTYVRKSAFIKAFQVQADLFRDVIKIFITLNDTKDLSIWNVYNALVGSDQAGASPLTLLSSTDKPYFIGGDFNLRHPLWDLTATHPHASCRDLIDWYPTKELQLLNPTKVSTHSRGGTLDLAFCIDRNAKCEVRTDFHTTSDHEILVSTIYKDQQLRAAGKLRNKALNDEIFHQFLEKTNNNRALETQEELRIEAADLIKNIHTALTGSCPRSKPRNFGTLWWTDEYEVTTSSCSSERSCTNAGLPEVSDQRLQDALLEVPAAREVLRPSFHKTRSGRVVKPPNRHGNVFVEIPQKTLRKATSTMTNGNLELSKKKLAFGSQVTKLANTE
ncbi:hypothetical protein EPUL_005699, partial [Erysiphe pulchra]